MAQFSHWIALAWSAILAIYIWSWEEVCCYHDFLREGSTKGAFTRYWGKVNIELVSLNIQRRNLIIIILFQYSTAQIWNYMYIKNSIDLFTPRLQKLFIFKISFKGQPSKANKSWQKLLSSCLCIYVLEYGEQSKPVIKYKVVSNNVL